MYQPMLPCPSCQRHTRVSDVSCPFCKDALPSEDTRQLRPAQVSRMSRTAIMLLGASLSLAGCGPSNKVPDPPTSPTTEPPGPDDDGGMQAKYGAPAPPDDDGASMAEYGAPAPPDDDGGSMAEYGAPAPPEPIDDGGAVKALYGVPAPQE